MIKIIILCCTLVSISMLNACGKTSPASSNTTYSSSGSSTSSSSSSSSSGAPYVYSGSVQRNLAFTSSITGITYPYHVYLPYNYDISAKTYPIIYGTDAQWIFEHFSQTIDARHKDVIFVGIEEGPLNSNRRFVDFLGPGTADYIKFFKTEFAPMIEKAYRINNERTYIGTSLGGLMGAVFLTKEPMDQPYFKNYLLFDGSFFAYDDTNLADEAARFNASKQLNITLILSSANNPGNEVPVDAFQKRYEARQYEGFKIYRRSYSIPHNDVANPSFDDTIDIIY